MQSIISRTRSMVWRRVETKFLVLLVICCLHKQGRLHGTIFWFRTKIYIYQYQSRLRLLRNQAARVRILSNRSIMSLKRFLDAVAQGGSDCKLRSKFYLFDDYPQAKNDEPEFIHPTKWKYYIEKTSFLGQLSWKIKALICFKLKFMKNIWINRKLPSFYMFYIRI